MFSEHLNTIRKTGEDILVYKYPLFNFLFQEDDNLLKWPFSNRILVTAYDLYKDSSLYSFLSSNKITLREYLNEVGLRRDVKIFADTGIYELEAKKSRTDLSQLMGELPELTPQEIFHAYEMIDPDFLVAPDEIILFEDNRKVKDEKLENIIHNFDLTLEYFDRKKVFPTLQGIEEEDINYLINYYKDHRITKIARGGLLPLRKSNRIKYYEVLASSEKLARNAEMSYIHAFGLSGIYALGEFFVHNNYDSIDTSMIYWISADHRYIQSNGYLIPVRKARLDRCNCTGCGNMKRSRNYPQSGRFMANLYYHNALVCRDLITWIFEHPKQARIKYPLYYPKSKQTPNPNRTDNSSIHFFTAATLQDTIITKYVLDESHNHRLSSLNRWYDNLRRKILIISGCSKRKKVKPTPNTIFDNPLELPKLQELLIDTKLTKFKAKELYKGKEHQQVLRAIGHLDKWFEVDHYILSAGFGLISSEMEIISYDSTFKNKSREELVSMQKSLNLITQINSIDWSTYDSVFFILNQTYYEVIRELIDHNTIGGELVLFHPDELFGYDTEEFRKFVKQGQLRYYLGREFEVRGSILLEYSYWLLKQGHVHPFVKFWHDLTQCPCLED